MTRHSKHSSTVRSMPRAVVLGRQFPGDSEAAVQAALDELENLLAQLEIRVVATVLQRQRTADPTLGEGKLAELAARVAEVRGDAHEEELLLVVDDALSPVQLRALEDALAGVEVIDRASVILRIFERHARTRVARLEVEIAALSHALPRVREDRSLGGREGGGGGRGERGHSNVTLKKQELRERIAGLRRELAGLRAAEETQRARRKDHPRAALVGYTNAGKSSLMRALTGSEVLVEDRLFATLDTTVRALSPETAPRILVSDTVGFIRELPHELVASFHATLAEARDAGLLLVVVDASDLQWRTQLAVTREALATIGAAAVPSLVIFNKIDRVDAATRAALAEELPAALQICAHAPEDGARLRAAVIEAFDASQVDDVLEVPFTEGHLLGEIRAHARVLAEEYTEAGALLRVRALPAALERWRGLLSTVRPITSPAELLAVVRRHGLELQAEDADFDRTGLDFLVVHARDESGTPWIVRTPRRPEVTASTYVEARVLRLVRPHLPVAAPDWQVHAPDVIAYPRISGTPAVTVTPEGPQWNILDPAAPSEAFLESFARALAALQSIAPEVASRAGVPTTTIAEVRAALSRSMDATREALQPAEAVWRRWQRWLADDAMWPQHLALVHGDLHPGHMLLGTDGRLVGILDWTEARVTDPSVDLAMFCGCFGRPALERLVERFARAGGTTWPRLVDHAAERWAAFPALAAEWALRTDNAAVLEHVRGQLAAITAETAA